MSELYRPIEPHDQGMLDAGDGHLVHWEVCGNPGGKPALVVHGGPGSGCSTGVRSYFDLTATASSSSTSAAAAAVRRTPPIRRLT